MLSNFSSTNVLGIQSIWYTRLLANYSIFKLGNINEPKSVRSLLLRHMVWRWFKVVLNDIYSISQSFAFNTLRLGVSSFVIFLILFPDKLMTSIVYGNLKSDSAILLLSKLISFRLSGTVTKSILLIWLPERFTYSNVGN